jgi:hypothetical protein
MESDKHLNRLSHTLTRHEPADEMMRVIPVFRTTSERWMTTLENRRPYGRILTTLASASLGVFVTASVKTFLEYGNTGRAFEGWFIASVIALFASIIFGISAHYVYKTEMLPLSAIVEEIKEIRERY